MHINIYMCLCIYMLVHKTLHLLNMFLKRSIREGLNKRLFITIMWMIIIKCSNVDKGRGGRGSDNVDKDFCMC